MKTIANSIEVKTTTLFPNLFAALKSQYDNRLKEFTTDLEQNKDVWSIVNDWRYKELFTASKKYTVWEISDLHKYLIDRKTKAINKEIEKELQHLLTVEKAADLLNIKVSVEWKKSRMWGSNPTCEAWVKTSNDSHYYNSGSIGGCGYDKLSTAVANAVNQDNSFLKAMYLVKEQNIDTKNHELFGYGVLPRLEGGVGVSCYPTIFKKIGFEWNNQAWGKTYDVYSVSKL